MWNVTMEKMIQISDPELDFNQLDADNNKLIIRDQSGSILLCIYIYLYIYTYIHVYMYIYIYIPYSSMILDGYRILMLNLSSWPR